MSDDNLINALNGVDHDIKEWLMQEYTKEMKNYLYLKHLDIDGLGCGDQDAHGDRIEGSSQRMQALEIRHEQL